MSPPIIRSFFTSNTHYQGEVDCRNHRSGIGQQVQRNGLLYEGSWKDGLSRHGHGIVYRKAEPGETYVKIYVGAWEGGRKEGFGVKYYKRGKYVGFWRRDQRSGRGFMWFDDSGNFYMGHWADDRFHGLGVLMEGRTGNLYQGEFRGGKKHGEGMYVHSRTGQIQRGFWTEGVFRTGTLEDWNRNQVLWPTVYPIPEIKVANFPEVFDGWMDQYSKALKI